MTRKSNKRKNPETKYELVEDIKKKVDKMKKKLNDHIQWNGCSDELKKKSKKYLEAEQE